jgi:hypothetical protein
MYTHIHTYKYTHTRDLQAREGSVEIGSRASGPERNNSLSHIVRELAPLKRKAKDDVREVHVGHSVQGVDSGRQ